MHTLLLRFLVSTQSIVCDMSDLVLKTPLQVTEDMYQKVCKWTKNVDVFAMDYLLIPIHDAAHWSLAIICHPGVS
jgi:Ulp1 family protease